MIALKINYKFNLSVNSVQVFMTFLHIWELNCLYLTYRVCNVWVAVAWVCGGVLHFLWLIFTWNKINYSKSDWSFFLSIAGGNVPTGWVQEKQLNLLGPDNFSVRNPNCPHDRYISASPQEQVFHLQGKVFRYPELPMLAQVWPWNSGMIHYKVCCNATRRLHNPILILSVITLTFWFPSA